jgi:hypothetical protein
MAMFRFFMLINNTLKFRTRTLVLDGAEKLKLVNENLPVELQQCNSLTHSEIEMSIVFVTSTERPY